MTRSVVRLPRPATPFPIAKTVVPSSLIWTVPLSDAKLETAATFVVEPPEPPPCLQPASDKTVRTTATPTLLASISFLRSRAHVANLAGHCRKVFLQGIEPRGTFVRVRLLVPTMTQDDFAREFESCFRSLWVIAFAITHDRPGAEDIVQEA